MRKKILTLFFALLVGHFTVYAGDTTYAKKYQSSIGYGFTFPLLKNGISAGPWANINWRNGWFELYYSAGDINWQELPTQNYRLHTFGYNYGMGVHIPLMKQKLTASKCIFNPTLDIDAGGMGAASLLSGDQNTYNSSLSFTIAPGFDIRFPKFYIGFSLGLMYNWYAGPNVPDYILPTTNDEQLGYLGMRGLILSPKLTFQLNTLGRKIPNLKVVAANVSYTDYKCEGCGEIKRLDDYTAYDRSGNQYLVTEYEVYPDSKDKYYYEDKVNYNIYTTVIPAYYGFKIGYETQWANAGMGATSLPSAGFVLRDKLMALDVTEAYGTIGMNSPSTGGGFLVMKNYYRGNIISGTAAIDVMSLLGSFHEIKLRKYHGYGTMKGAGRYALGKDTTITDGDAHLFETKKYRILLGCRFSLASLGQVIDTVTAITYGNIKYTTGNLYQPSAKYGFTYTSNLYFAVEINTISFFMDFLPANYYPYASGTMFGLSWQIPTKLLKR